MNIQQTVKLWTPGYIIDNEYDIHQKKMVRVPSFFSNCCCSHNHKDKANDPTYKYMVDVINKCDKICKTELYTTTKNYKNTEYLSKPVQITFKIDGNEHRLEMNCRFGEVRRYGTALIDVRMKFDGLYKHTPFVFVDQNAFNRGTDEKIIGTIGQTYIVVDDKYDFVEIHGNSENLTHIRQQINDYKENVSNYVESLRKICFELDEAHKEFEMYDTVIKCFQQKNIDINCFGELSSRYIQACEKVKQLSNKVSQLETDGYFSFVHYVLKNMKDDVSRIRTILTFIDTLHIES